MQDKIVYDNEKIKALKHGECYIVPESDYGKAEVWRINDIYLLFDIPMYGGPPIFYKSFTLMQIDEIIETYNSWT